VRQAISRAIAGTGAALIRDMSKVMAELKARHTGRMDFARACHRDKGRIGEPARA
jgi:uncharacterized protein YqeY